MTDPSVSDLRGSRVAVFAGSLLSGFRAASDRLLRSRRGRHEHTQRCRQDTNAHDGHGASTRMHSEPERPEDVAGTIAES